MGSAQFASSGELYSRADKIRLAPQLANPPAATAPGVKAPGSDTMKNLSVAALIGRTFGGLSETKPAQALASRLSFLGLGEDDIRGLVVQAMLDPELFAGLMTQASTESVDTFITAAQRRLPNIVYGTAGATAGLQQR